MSSLAVDTVTTRHLVLDARRAVDSLHGLRDTVCPDWIGNGGRHWLDVATRSADMAWLLLAAAIRRRDPTSFLARVELLTGLRLLLDEVPDLLRAESRVVFGALDDTEVTLRVLRTGLCIRGRHPNPAAAARLRQVLAVLAADLAVAEPAAPDSGVAGRAACEPDAVTAAERWAVHPAGYARAVLDKPSRPGRSHESWPDSQPRRAATTLVAAADDSAAVTDDDTEEGEWPTGDDGAW